MKINTVIFYSDELPETDSSISSWFVFNYSVRKKPAAAPGRCCHAIALPVTCLFIYGFIDVGRCRCGAVKNHLILVKSGFNCADWAAASSRFSRGF